MHALRERCSTSVTRVAPCGMGQNWYWYSRLSHWT